MLINVNEKVETRDRDHDVLPPHSVALFLEWRRRVVAIQHYDRYIARAVGHPRLQGLWRDLKRQDMEDARRVKDWLDRDIVPRPRWAMEESESRATRWRREPPPGDPPGLLLAPGPA